MHVCATLLKLIMASLTVLLLLSFILVTSSNESNFVGNQSFSEAKSNRPSVFHNDSLSTNESKYHSHCKNRTWLVESSTGECECADSLDGLIYCDKSTKEVFISSQFCMSYDVDRGEEVVGRCPYIYTSFYELNTTNVGLYVKLPSNVSELERLFCDGLNREGYFCSRCKKNYLYPMYPDFLKCVECDPKHYARNWVLYVFLSFVPLTIFLILVVCFRISATSAPMNSFIFVSQIMTLPPFERQFYRTINSTVYPKCIKIFMHFLHSLYGIWNLNFFTTLFHPFCVPHQTPIDVIFLAYIAALYPLLLLSLLYTLIELHSKNVRVLVWLWKPFQFGYKRFQRQWDIRSSIIDAFATFFLLSYVKLLFITYDLLASSEIWSKNGSVIEITSYFDATIQIHHKRKGITILVSGILISLIFVYLPTLLLLLYPCRCCQKFLTRCSCFRFQFLRFLMDSFLGSYKDGTNGTRDYRYFAFIFLFFRITISVEYAISYFNFLLTLLLTCSILVTLIAIAQPYVKKYSLFNRLDPLMILFLIIWLVFFSSIHFTSGRHTVIQYTVLPLGFLSLIFPMILVVSNRLFKRTKKLYQRWVCRTQCQGSDDESWYNRPSHPYTPQHKPSYGTIENPLKNNA